MKPLSNYLHKAMIPFSGMPFLAYSLLAAPDQSQIIIIVGYLSEQIVKYFGNCYKGRRIEYLQQRHPCGTGDALVQFSEAYHPKDPIIVWQADQLIFPNEVALLSQSQPNSAIGSGSDEDFHDFGFWKIKPSTLARLKGHFDGSEYRALPVLEQEELNRIRVQREKLELSFTAWGQIEQQCKRLKQSFSTGSHLSAV